MMKAVVCDRYGSAELLKLKQVARPVPRDDEILIQVKAAAVNTSDVRIRGRDTGGGLFGLVAKLGISVVIGVRGPRRNILGSAVSGIVAKVGSKVTKHKVGDEIFALTGLSFGGHAEYCALPEKRATAKKPSNATFVQAAALPFGGSSSLYFLRKAGLSRGKNVLVYGATGACGTAALQICNAIGASVDAICCPSGMNLVEELGVDKKFNYESSDWKASEKRYDIVYDAVGKIRKRDVKHLLPHDGRFCTVDGLDVAKEYSSDLETIGKWFEEGKYHAVIDRTYPVEEIITAHKYVESGRKKGNVVLTF